MKGSRISACAGVLLLFGVCCSSAWPLGPQAAAGDTASAQSTVDTTTAAPSGGTVVPRLVEFSGVATDAAGKPASGTVTITFSLYELQEGGAPLWSETQSVTLDSQADGHYTVFLGAASADGLPLDLFTSGAARWLGVAPALAGVGEQRIAFLEAKLKKKHEVLAELMEEHVALRKVLGRSDEPMSCGINPGSRGDLHPASPRWRGLGGSAKLIRPGETEAGSGGDQPCRRITGGNSSKPTRRGRPQTPSSPSPSDSIDLPMP